MRFVTIAGAVIIAGSTAALAQVARTPVERKDPPGNAGAPVSDAAAGNTAMNVAADNATPSANDTGAPGSTKTEPAAPPR